MAPRRQIFEEVGKRSDSVTPAPIPTDRPRDFRRHIRIWLAALVVSVVAAIVAGGVTRLTDSGLAITEWKPVTGALPPFSAGDWQAEFGKIPANSGIHAAELFP